MSINLSWYTPLRIVHSHIFGELESEQIQFIGQDLQTYLNEGIAPIHLLLDDRHISLPTSDLPRLQHSLSFIKQDSDKLGWIFDIGESFVMAKLMLPLLSSQGNINYVRVSSIEEALVILKTCDESLRIN